MTRHRTGWLLALALVLATGSGAAFGGEPAEENERSGMFFVDQGNTCYVPQNIKGLLIKDWEIELQAYWGPAYGAGNVFMQRIRNYGGNGCRVCDKYLISPATGAIFQSSLGVGGQLQNVNLISNNYAYQNNWHGASYTFPLDDLATHYGGVNGAHGGEGMLISHGLVLGCRLGQTLPPTDFWFRDDLSSSRMFGYFNSTRWNRTRESMGMGQYDSYTAAAGSGVVLIRSYTGLVALDILTGETIWQRSPVASGGYVSCRDGVFYVPSGSKVLALDATTGATLWETGDLGSISSVYPPAVTPDRVLVASGGNLTALNRADGSFIWQKPIVGAPGFGKGPIIAGESIWIANGTAVHSYSLATGDPLTSFDVGNSIYSMCVARGRIFLRTGPTATMGGNGDGTELSYTTGTTKLVALRSAQTVRGKVVDPSGEPVPFARVEIGDLATGSDEDGSFNFPWVEAGSHTLTFDKDGYQADSTGVTVSAGQTTTTGDLMLQPAGSDPVLNASYYYSHSLFGGYEHGVYREGRLVTGHQYTTTIYIHSNRKLASLNVTVDQQGTDDQTLSAAFVSMDRTGVYTYKAAFTPSEQDGGAHLDGVAVLTCSGTDTAGRAFTNVPVVDGEILIDTIPPAPSTALAARPTADGAYQLNWTPSTSGDVYMQRYAKDGTYNWSWNLEPAARFLEVSSADAVKSWSIAACDYAGNRAVSNAVVPDQSPTPPADTSPPVFTFSRIAGWGSSGYAVLDEASGKYVARAGKYDVFILPSEAVDGTTTQWWFEPAGTGGGEAKADSTIESIRLEIKADTPNGEARFYVAGSDLAGNATPKTLAGTFIVDTQGPVASAVTVSEITETSACVAYTTNESSRTIVEYGRTPCFGQAVSRTLHTDERVTSHDITLTELVPGTTYYGRVVARDRLSNETLGEVFTFTTPGAPDDATPPLVSVGYFRDPDCAQQMPSFDGTAMAKAGIVYLKIVSNEGLGTAPLVSIDQAGTADVVNEPAESVLGGDACWRLAYTVVAHDGGAHLDGPAAVTLSGLMDKAGNAAADLASSFCIDTTPPAVSSTVPEDGAGEVYYKLNSVTVEYDDILDGSTVSTVDYSVSGSTSGSRTVNSVTVSEADGHTRVRLNLDTAVTFDQGETVTVAAKNGVYDVAGNRQASNHGFTFATASNYYTISGRLTKSDGSAYRAWVHAANDTTGQTMSAYADTSGNYTIVDITPGDWRVYPSSSNTKWSPEERSVTVINANISGQNFTGTVYPYRVYGYVRDASGVGIGDVTVTCPGAATEEYATTSYGYYNFYVLEGATVTVTPSKTGWSFSPASQTVTTQTTYTYLPDFTGTQSSGPNDPPVAEDQDVTTPEDAAKAITLIATDPDGDALTYQIVTNPAHGMLAGTGASRTYTPDANWHGSDSFTFKVSDGQADSNTATVSITVSPVNDAPVTDSFEPPSPVSIEAGSTETFGVWCSDPDGDALVHAWKIDGAAVGISDNLLDYNPVEADAGAHTIEVLVSDGQGGSVANTWNVTVTVPAPPNTPPVATDDATATDEDAAVAIDVLANDSDADGDALSVLSVTQPAHGAVVNNGDNVTYTPDANFNGTDGFTCTITDGNGGEDTATVTVTVSSVNDAPQVSASAVPSSGEAPLAVQFTAAGSDVDEDALTYSWVFGDGDTSSVQNPQHTYAVTGTYTAIVTVSDGAAQASDSLSVTVSDAPPPPPPGPDFVCTIRASGGDYATLSAWEAAVESDLTSPASLVFSISDRDTYDPATDDGTAVTFTGGGTGTLKHVSVAGKVYVVACAGAVQAGAVTCASGHAFTISDAGTQVGLAVAECYNDWPDGLADRVRVEGWTTDAEHHVVIRAAAGQRHDGTPGSAGAFTGFAVKTTANYQTLFDLRERYTVVEGVIASLGHASGYGFRAEEDDVAVRSCIALDAKGTNTGFFSAFQSLGLFSNDLAIGCRIGFGTANYAYGRFYNCTAIRSVSRGFSMGAGITQGNLCLRNCLAVGSVDEDFRFQDSADTVVEHCASGDETADDAGGDGNRTNQTFAFVDEAGDDYHLAATDAGAKDRGMDLSADPVLPVDTDMDGEVRGDAWDIGADEVGGGGPPPNNPPIAENGNVTMAEDTAAAITLVATDPDGDALSYQIVTNPAHGVLTGTGASRTYTPEADYNGTDSFTFRANDGQADSNVATVSITVSAVNDGPAAADDVAATDEDTPVVIDVLANDSDIDGDVLSVVLVTQPAHGLAVNNGDSVTYTPEAGFNGTDSFSYTASDGNGGTDTATVSITVEDTTGPEISISSTVLKGTVSDASGVANLKINGEDVAVAADGSWEKEVFLAAETTAVTIETTDNEGNTTTETVTVTK